jgi:chorismate--pyruvate lyase
MQRNNIVWQPSLDIKTPGLLQAWLNHRDSFIQRLAHHGIHHPTIDVIREGWLQPEIWECELLGLASHDVAFIREVSIGNSDQVWLYGRTVVPKAMLNHKKELSSLENRSLGSVLFQDPDIKRDAFEFVYAEPSKLWQGCFPMIEQWIRRSLFHLHDSSLLLTEVFMPDLTTLCMKN